MHILGCLAARCSFHLSNGHKMGQRIKLIVLVQRAQLFPAWLILHGQRVMPLPFSKSKSSPRQPGRGPQDYAFGSTSYTSLPVPRSHAAFFYLHFPSWVSSWPFTSPSMDPMRCPVLIPHLTGYSHGAHLATVLLCCPKLHSLLCAAVTLHLQSQDPTPWQWHWCSFSLWWEWYMYFQGVSPPNGP